MCRGVLCLVGLLSLFAPSVHAATPITDTSAVEAILQDLFPGQLVSREWEMHLDSTQRVEAITYPDALKQEPVFVIVGPEPIQTNAARYTGPRVVRLKFFAISPEHGHARAVGVLQYRFLDPRISGGTSVSTALLLARESTHWRATSHFEVDQMHHCTITGVQATDLDGDGVEELLLDSQSGGAETVDSTLMIFRIRQRRLQPILATATRLQQYSRTDSIEMTAVLDLPAAIQERATRFCFAETVYQKGMQRFATPKTSRFCLQPGDGVSDLPMQADTFDP